MIKAHNVVVASRPGSIADPFWDLLAQLDYGKRQGLTRRLAIGFYEGWHPSRAEVALLVDFELGRITEQEYLAAGPRYETLSTATPPQSATTLAPSADRAASGHHRPRPMPGTPAGRVPPTRIATFNTDCGHLAPPFRLIVRGLTSNGYTFRGSRRYRLVSLHYVLLPPIGAAGRKSHPITPVLYTAAISCVPDIAAPRADADGRNRQHSVRSGHVAGSRGPWPMADGVRLLEFLFAEQQPIGAVRSPDPVGVLQVDLSLGRATWRALRPRSLMPESRVTNG